MILEDKNKIIEDRIKRSFEKALNKRMNVSQFENLLRKAEEVYNITFTKIGDRKIRLDGKYNTLDFQIVVLFDYIHQLAIKIVLKNIK